METTYKDLLKKLKEIRKIKDLTTFEMDQMLKLVADELTVHIDAGRPIEPDFAKALLGIVQYMQKLIEDKKASA